MTVVVRFFALSRDLAGTSQSTLDLPDSSTVADAMAELVQRHPALGPQMNRLAVAVNLEYVDRSRTLRDGEELALIPPVSGG
ncbi:MAG: molybdopterin converting factor subunit 1 [Tepidisphaeraceae bacterium]